MEICPFCKSGIEQFIEVQGHAQCPVCTQVVEGCCQGEAIWHTGENLLQSLLAKDRSS